MRSPQNSLRVEDSEKGGSVPAKAVDVEMQTMRRAESRGVKGGIVQPVYPRFSTRSAVLTTSVSLIPNLSPTITASPLAMSLELT